MFQAIFFDNDGVLVDTEGLYFQATREALAAHRVGLDQAAYVQLFMREGRGAWHLLRDRGVDEAAIAAAHAARDRRYLELLEGGDVLVPGAREALALLAPRFRLGIVTSSQPEPFAYVHRRAGILAHFELVLTRDQYDRAKPDPEPYLRAVERVGLPPARCLVVEDSERGLTAAKAAGLACWVVPSALTRDGRFDAADARFDDLASLAAALLRRVAGE
jgi:HAD superfamily hydrolase (TIGR01509 family)